MTSKAERKRRKRTVVIPGREVLFEDLIRRAALDREPVRTRRLRERGQRVSERPESPICVREVERRVLRGLKTLRAVPDPEARFQRVTNGWPQYVREHMDAYNSVEAIVPRFKPTPADISDYLTAVAWTRHLPVNEWKILWWRSFDLSFGLIARYIGRSDETVRRRYRDTIIDVWTVANSIQVS